MATKQRMTAPEARDCVNRVRRHLDSARKHLLDLYERQGWRALGYASWRACAAAEFGLAKSHLYRLLTAAEVERDLSPVGESAAVPERVLRPLGPLGAPDRRDAWALATARAGGDMPTAEVVRESVEELASEAVRAMSREQRLAHLQHLEQRAARRAEARQERDGAAERERHVEAALHHLRQARRHFLAVGGDEFAEEAHGLNAVEASAAVKVEALRAA